MGALGDNVSLRDVGWGSVGPHLGGARLGPAWARRPPRPQGLQFQDWSHRAAISSLVKMEKRVG